MLLNCVECEHGTFFVVIYFAVNQVRISLTEQSCGCDIGVTGRLRLAAAALGQAARKQSRTLDTPAMYTTEYHPI